MSKRFPLKKDQLKTLGLVALMIAGYVVLVHLPGAERRAALMEQVRLAEEALARDRGLDLEAMRADAQQAQAELEADERPLPAERDVFRVLDGVSGSLLDRGIRNHELSQGDPRRYRDYTLQPISLEFQGGFTDAFAALQRVETMRYPVRIDRLEMIGDTDDTRGEVLTVVQLGAFVDEEADDE
jgi:Tfp pilus assembly protein PilO